MQWRAAWAVWRGVPMVESVRVARLKPGDAVVLEVPERMSADARARMTDIMDLVFPNNPVVVLDGGKTLHVIEERSAGQ